jgi:hypothetical protein
MDACSIVIGRSGISGIAQRAKAEAKKQSSPPARHSVELRSTHPGPRPGLASRANASTILAAQDALHDSTQAPEMTSGLAEPAAILFDRCYGDRRHWFLAAVHRKPRGTQRPERQQGEKSMARSLSIVGFLALAIGLLWIGQGTGAIRWPPSSFMINQLQWAGYGAVLGAVGLILIWQGNR